MLSRQSYQGHAFNACIGTCSQPETPCEIQAEPLKIPYVGIHFNNFRIFVDDMKAKMVLLDKSRCFSMVDKACALCDAVTSSTEENEDFISSLLDLADLSLVYDLQSEAYTLYSRAINIANNNGFDPECALDAWLAIAKLLKAGKFSTCIKHSEAGNQILNWLVTRYQMEEALAYLY